MPRFVVHKHHASRLHWDFRLELDGVLKSWAVPKEPPAEEGIKRLAVQVDDHPLSYIAFEGEIPEGSYGAGRVEIWDKGRFVMESSTSSKMVFELKGTKLRGVYVLLKFARAGPKNWLLFRKKQVKEKSITKKRF